MENILYCLDVQSLEKTDFEIILVEDRGGSDDGRSLKARFPSLNINYYNPSSGWGLMGYMRNYGLSKAKGEIVLFLDDDTVILDNDFLKKLYSLFRNDAELMAVIPEGSASYCLLKGRYSFHEPFFFTNRCMAYRRSCLIEMKGFDNSFIGQEDVEFAIRFLAKNHKYIKSSDVKYYHPPLLVQNNKKAEAVGYSFSKSKYQLWFKILLGVNGARWLPGILIPTKRNIYMSKFAYGYLRGFIKGLLNMPPPLYG